MKFEYSLDGLRFVLYTHRNQETKMNNIINNRRRNRFSNQTLHVKSGIFGIG